MCTHVKTTVTETRRSGGRIYRRRKCGSCRESFVTEEKRCDGMPAAVKAVQQARIEAYRQRKA